VPAHHDRLAALRGDLARLATLATLASAEAKAQVITA
jgi:hypothetical protein